jgi:hypothetical protein
MCAIRGLALGVVVEQPPVAMGVPRSLFGFGDGHQQVVALRDAAACGEGYGGGEGEGEGGIEGGEGEGEGGIESGEAEAGFYAARIARAVAGRGEAERATTVVDTAPLAAADGAAPKLTIAICAATTTRVRRGPNISAFRDMALVSTLIPSLVRTAEAAYRYRVYVTFDAGDGFIDSVARRCELRALLDAELVAALASHGVQAQAVVMRFANGAQKPGPAFNFMMAAAAADGADYLYRINDDTELAGAEWTTQAVGQLLALQPPNVGVAGPLCGQGNREILTHDFVHRQHLEIFPTYYPPVFTDWFLDDWISAVYGPFRTRFGPWAVAHWNDTHGQRYHEDVQVHGRLEGEIERGHMRVEEWAERWVSCTGGEGEAGGEGGGRGGGGGGGGGDKLGECAAHEGCGSARFCTRGKQCIPCRACVNPAMDAIDQVCPLKCQTDPELVGKTCTVLAEPRAAGRHEEEGDEEEEGEEEEEEEEEDRRGRRQARKGR